MCVCGGTKKIKRWRDVAHHNLRSFMKAPAAGGRCCVFTDAPPSGGGISGALRWSGDTGKGKRRGWRLHDKRLGIEVGSRMRTPE